MLSVDSLFKEQLLSTGPRTVPSLTKFERNSGSVSPSGALIVTVTLIFIK